MVPLSKIKADPNQPRKIFVQESIDNLAASIKEHGIIKNIEVDENYVIISGENRWRAAKQAGLNEIPCRIIPALSKEQRFDRQLHENIHHATMNPMDVARSIKRIHDEQGKEYQEIAVMLGKHRSWVFSHLRLLASPKDLQQRVQSGSLAFRTLDRVQTMLVAEEKGKIPAGSTNRVLKLRDETNMGVYEMSYLATAISQNPKALERYFALPLKGKSGPEIVALVDTVGAPLSKMAVGIERQEETFRHALVNARIGLGRFPSVAVSPRSRTILKQRVEELRDAALKWLEAVDN